MEKDHVPMQRCADVRSQLLCYWTVLEMNYCWACITLTASYFAKLCRLTSCSPLSFFSHRLFCRHSRKQSLVAHFETMALQLYMMFLAFSMQLHLFQDLRHAPHGLPSETTCAFSCMLCNEIVGNGCECSSVIISFQDFAEL